MSLTQNEITKMRQMTSKVLASGKRIMFRTADNTAYLSARVEDGKLRLSAATLDAKGCHGDANALFKLEGWLNDLGLTGECEQRSQSYRCMTPLDSLSTLLDHAPWESLAQGDFTWPLGSASLIMLQGGIDE